MSEFLVESKSEGAGGFSYAASPSEAEALVRVAMLVRSGVSHVSLYQRVDLAVNVTARIVKRRKSAEKLSPPASETAPIPPSVKDGGGQGGSGALRAASPESGGMELRVSTPATRALYDSLTPAGMNAVSPLLEKQQSVKKSKHPDPEKCGVVGCKFDVDKNGRCRDHGPGAVPRG